MGIPAIYPEVENDEQNERGKYSCGDGVDTLENKKKPE